MRRLCPNLPGDLIDCDSGKPGEFEGVVVPLVDLTATSVEFLVVPKHEGSVRAETMNRLLHELWRRISEKVERGLPDGSSVRITVWWSADVEIKEVPEELR